MFIQLSNISKSYSNKDILKGIKFTINDGERVGLVGKNGSGKSTLFKIVAGLERYDGGSMLIRPKETTIGYIPQTSDLMSETTVKQALSKFVERWEEHKIDLTLQKLKIENMKERKLGTLSSGQRTKIYLARLILNDPDVLLLDEPTNHLDIESLEWLERYVRGYRGTVMVISHDRKFLDRTVKNIFELEDGFIRKYGGNYSFYKHQKQIEVEASMRSYESQQKTIKHLEKIVDKQKRRAKELDKNRKSTRDNDSFAPTFFANRASKKMASAFKTIEKRLENFEKREKPKSDFQLKALFALKQESSKTVVYLKSVSKRFDNKNIFEDFSLSIQKGERFALLGRNGSGKSTLLKIILGEIQPSEGLVELGNNVIIGYLSQEHKELNSEDKVIDELMKNTRLTKTDAYKLLIRFLIPVEKVNQTVNSLSSGEKAKLLLAEIMASGANFIILDEPTNHLDILSREALEEAVANYEGTLLVVSHDRCFIDKIGITRKLELD